ncbi:dTMP kinase [Desmospora profundinema]|uniref:Thymidylate kinase n=1 Tax=Desmospora profundinema TaxID=1571184 RepID=A0ABU1IRG5_9BACL|nr:dTMP kinase [Desmospora profundinema]MDR6227137.1 dTMP kinase [Desmospora profundinema]
MNGLFITFEGPEGGGKSTQIGQLAHWLKERGWQVTLTREPGGTPIGDRVRTILLDPASSEMVLRTEMLLYAASRAQLVEQVIRPALDRGDVVLCDRYVDSSIVYQSVGRLGAIEEVIAINRIATGGLTPSRTYLLDLPVAEGMRRLQSRREGIDRMEGKGDSFHEQVRQGFLQLARRESDRFVTLDAVQSPEKVFADILRDIQTWLPAPVNHPSTDPRGERG